MPNLAQDLLIGPCKQVWTFWVDMLIICVGMLDLWLGQGLGRSNFVAPGFSTGPEAHSFLALLRQNGPPGCKAYGWFVPLSRTLAHTRSWHVMAESSAVGLRSSSCFDS